MEENHDLKYIKRSSIISLFGLFFQSGYSAILGLGANLVLTILLTPAIFGIYFTVLSTISLLNYFSDIGLAASLIQKKEISDEDVKTTFTLQQILIIVIITIGFLLTPLIVSFYKLPDEGKYLFWSLLMSFFISSLKTIPSVFLERKIQFQKIVLVQIIENTFFYSSVIIFALSGIGLRSFTYAVVLRAITGLIAIYSISFWKPQIGISQKSLKSLLSFGLPFQTASFLALFKDDLITLYLGKTLGFTNLGYIGWAKKWAEAPIRIIMDNISRILFPVIARIQHDQPKVSSVMEKIITYQTRLLAPTLIGLALLMQPLIHVIPRYQKWEPALPLFYLFCLSAFLSSYSTPFINLFNALGKAKTSLAFMAFWTIATWILVPLLTHLYGIYGFPLTLCLLSLSFVVVVIKARQFIVFDLLKITYSSLISTIIMSIFVFVFFSLLKESFVSLILGAVLGLFSYYIVLLTIFRINILKEITTLFHP